MVIGRPGRGFAGFLGENPGVWHISDGVYWLGFVLIFGRLTHPRQNMLHLSNGAPI
ncbi:hypothetical protein CCP4SC76_7410002 [Gammaproteobacteria bacterium]